MEFIEYAHRQANLVAGDERHAADYAQLTEVIAGITDRDIIEHFNGIGGGTKSVSKSINALLRERLVAAGWDAESPIFQDLEYTDKKWRLDFAKNNISVEVAFNHGEAIAWNLLKPALAGELNHVQKAIQTDLGVLITATADLKKAGGFDSAVGEYEKHLRYLNPMRNFLTVPMMVIGLQAPKTFRIQHDRQGNVVIGSIVML